MYAFEVEMLVVMHALEFAKANSWDCISLESDTIYVVDLLKLGSFKVPSRYIARQSLCLDVISKILFKFSHIYRKGKRVANLLSKHVLEVSQAVWSTLCAFCTVAHLAGIVGLNAYRFS